MIVTIRYYVDIRYYVELAASSLALEAGQRSDI